MKGAEEARLLSMSMVALLADVVVESDEPEALMMTTADLFVAACIHALEQMTTVDRDIALTKHTEHVARLLAEEYPRR